MHLNCKSNLLYPSKLYSKIIQGLYTYYPPGGGVAWRLKKKNALADFSVDKWCNLCCWLVTGLFGLMGLSHVLTHFPIKCTPKILREGWQNYTIVASSILVQFLVTLNMLNGYRPKIGNNKFCEEFWSVLHFVALMSFTTYEQNANSSIGFHVSRCLHFQWYVFSESLILHLCTTSELCFSSSVSD